MPKTHSSVDTISRNLKYMHILTIWNELTEIVGGDQHLAANLTTAYFLSQLAGSTHNPTSPRNRRIRARAAAITLLRRGNPRDESKPNRRAR